MNPHGYPTTSGSTSSPATRCPGSSPSGSRAATTSTSTTTIRTTPTTRRWAEPRADQRRFGAANSRCPPLREIRPALPARPLESTKASFDYSYLPGGRLVQPRTFHGADRARPTCPTRRRALLDGEGRRQGPVRLPDVALLYEATGRSSFEEDFTAAFGYPSSAPARGGPARGVRRRRVGEGSPVSATLQFLSARKRCGTSGTPATDPPALLEAVPCGGVQTFGARVRRYIFHRFMECCGDPTRRLARSFARSSEPVSEFLIPLSSRAH